jgi:hypothetical protein
MEPEAQYKPDSIPDVAEPAPWERVTRGMRSPKSVCGLQVMRYDHTGRTIPEQTGNCFAATGKLIYSVGNGQLIVATIETSCGSPAGAIRKAGTERTCKKLPLPLTDIFR